MIWKVLICVLCVSVFFLIVAVSKVNKKAASGSDGIERLSSKLKAAEEDLRLRQTEFARLQDAFEDFKRRTIHNLNELNNQDKTVLSALTDLRSDTLPIMEERIQNLMLFSEKQEKETAELKESLAKQNEQIIVQDQEIRMLRANMKRLDERLSDLQRELYIILNPAQISHGLNDPPETPAPANIGTKDLNAEKQRIFLEMENTNDNFFVTGKGGTGKSYLLNYFREHTRKTVLFTAPTGVAALNIKGTTLHRAFGGDNLRLGAEIKLGHDRADVLKHAQTIVIDEVSMVRSDVLHQIDAVLRDICKKDLPFGGKQMLLFGDVFQLPPVVKKSEKEARKAMQDRFGGVWFFHAPGFKAGRFHFRELKELFRFKKGEGAAEHIAALDRIRDGSFTKSDIDLFNTHVGVPQEEELMTLVPTRDKVTSTNETELARLPHAREYSYNSPIQWKDALLKKEKDNEPDFPVETTVKLRVGALVMFCSNDLNGRWVNGTLGIIAELTDTSVKVSVEGKTYPVEKEAFTQYSCRYDKTTGSLIYDPIATLTQYPLKVAYAITIHKSQGMTYPKLAIDLNGCFDAGQAYVALSRCSNFDFLYLKDRISERDIKYSQESVNFYNEMKSMEQ